MTIRCRTTGIDGDDRIGWHSEVDGMAARRPPRQAGAVEVRSAIIDRVEATIGAIAERAVVELQHTFPAYAALSGQQLLPGVEGDLRRALGALRDRRPPSADELQAAGAVGEERAGEGLPLDVMLQGFQLVARLAWQELRAAAVELSADSQALLELSEDVWAWLNDVTVEAANAHRRIDLASIRRAERQRMTLMSALLDGALSPGDAHAAVVTLGLPSRPLYRAFRARPMDGRPAAEVHRVLDGRWAHVQVVAIEGERDIIGVLVGDDLPEHPAICAGIGPAVAVPELARSFTAATRALDAAWALGLGGQHTLDRLGLRAVVVSEHDIGESLVEQMLAPLDATRGMASDVTKSVRAYLEADASVERAAAVVGVHPNTMRYRLRRFEQLSGTSLERVEDLVRIWWALQRQQMHEVTGVGDEDP